MSKRQLWATWLALLASGCVEAGSLDNEEEFRSLLSLDGGPTGQGSGGGPSGTGGSGTGGSSMGGTGGSGSGTGGSSMSGTGGSSSGGTDAGMAGGMGCPEACDIFRMRCASAGCHAATGSAAGLDLASPDIGMRLADKAAGSMACSGEVVIDPASPEDSLLYGKLLDPPLCGTRMPLGAPLSDMQIDCVLRWLDDPVCE